MRPLSTWGAPVCVRSLRASPPQARLRLTAGVDVPASHWGRFRVQRCQRERPPEGQCHLLRPTKPPREAFLNADLLTFPWLPSLQRLPGADRQKGSVSWAGVPGLDAVLPCARPLSLALHLCPGRQQPGEGHPGRPWGKGGSQGVKPRDGRPGPSPGGTGTEQDMDGEARGTGQPHTRPRQPWAASPAFERGRVLVQAPLLLPKAFCMACAVATLATNETGPQRGHMRPQGWTKTGQHHQVGSALSKTDTGPSFGGDGAGRGGEAGRRGRRPTACRHSATRAARVAITCERGHR